MQGNPKSTKTALIMAAGELFSLNGVSGTSVRAIAARAGVNAALINYHFGSKDGLVHALIDFVLSNYRHYMPDEPLENDREWWKTKAGQRRVVTSMVDQAFEFIRPRSEFPWINTFIMRSAEANEIGRKRILEEILIPGCIRYTKVYARITGSTDYQRARCWALSVFSSAFIYATNPAIIDETCPGKRPGENFYDELKSLCTNMALRECGIAEDGETVSEHQSVVSQ